MAAELILTAETEHMEKSFELTFQFILSGSHAGAWEREKNLSGFAPLRET